LIPIQQLAFEQQSMHHHYQLLATGREIAQVQVSSHCLRSRSPSNEGVTLLTVQHQKQRWR